MDYTYADIAGMFDHALLRPNQTDAEMEAGCRRAREYGVASVCLNPHFVPRCNAILAGSGVLTCTVIGFPHGIQTTSVKLQEIREACAGGCAEVDMVVNIGKVCGGDWDFVAAEIRAATELSHSLGAIIKIIFENCYLDDAQKIHLCEICTAAGADFVKTSTGFGATGATIADLKLMRAHTPPQIRVKASGGMRTLEQVLEVRALGVARVGCSNSFVILDECRKRLAAAGRA